MFILHDLVQVDQPNFKTKFSKIFLKNKQILYIFIKASFINKIVVKNKAVVNYTNFDITLHLSMKFVNLIFHVQKMYKIHVINTNRIIEIKSFKVRIIGFLMYFLAYFQPLHNIFNIIQFIMFILQMEMKNYNQISNKIKKTQQSAKNI